MVLVPGPAREAELRPATRGAEDPAHDLALLRIRRPALAGPRHPRFGERPGRRSGALHRLSDRRGARAVSGDASRHDRRDHADRDPGSALEPSSSPS